MRPVNWRLRTHIAGSAFCTLGGCPISMIVVCMNPSAATSPRTPPIVIRSPIVKVLPRKMMRYPARDEMTFCSANAIPAVARPMAVVSRAGLSSQIDSKPKTVSTNTATASACRDQKRAAGCRSGSVIPLMSARPAKLTKNAKAINARVRISLYPFSGLMPTQRMPSHSIDSPFSTFGSHQPSARARDLA